MEENMKKAVVTFGRMNPFTVGHEENIKQVEAEAKRIGAEPFVFLSHSQDKKKNPLDYNIKSKILHRLFPKSVKLDPNKEVIHMFSALRKLYLSGYTDVTIMVGDDRDEEGTDYKKYNGNEKNYTFNSITTKSSGARTEGISGTKMREYATANDFINFSKNLPTRITTTEAKQVFDATRAGLSLVESFKQWIKTL
jgi:hypothetical protein